MVRASSKSSDTAKGITALRKSVGHEGVAYPPLGDVKLDEAMEITHDKFIITGGISAIETANLTTKADIFDYTKNLFKEMKPYANRFVFSASCNTSIETPFEIICWFKEAWEEYRDI